MNDVSETSDDPTGERLGQPNRRIQHVSLAKHHRDQIRELPGFNKKTHRVPDDVNSHTQAFVAKLAAGRVKDDLDRVFAELRSAFRFRRSEIQSTDWEDGSGSITTPYFRYGSSVFQDPDAVHEVVWRRDVSEITDFEKLLTEDFASAFGNVFDTIEFAPPEPIELEQIIDRVESFDDDRVRIEYDRRVTSCTVTLQGCDERIDISREAFHIVHPQAESPRVLIESLFRVQNRLLDDSGQSESP